jgi:uncharacterized protein (DUF885 family)
MDSIARDGDDLSMDTVWVSLPEHQGSAESMPNRVRRVWADLADLENFYNISMSQRRHDRLKTFYAEELQALSEVSFGILDQQGKVDYILLKNFLTRKSHQLGAEKKSLKAMEQVLPFMNSVAQLCESRQDVEPMQAQQVAQQLNDIGKQIARVQKAVEDGAVKVPKAIGLKACNAIPEMRERLQEFFGFYQSYDPLFDWWVAIPWKDVDGALARYLPLVQTKLAGMHPDNADEIVGEAIGREALLVELEAEMIAYSPEDLIGLANQQYAWCETQMKAASQELGFNDDWKAALEHVKTQFVPPGEQTQLALSLAREGASFVRANDLVTVPPIVDETCRMFMMSQDLQKLAPFFLGGPYLQVAYPTADMSHDLKKMVMRGNNRHFSRATVFHELIPGHRLQMHFGARHQTHRADIFSTPFFIEGWAMYWEFVFWERGDFFVSPKDRIGTLFWRMHRCARIILTLRFHLGQLTPQECIDFLVDRVGHERFTAEGEVRRWLNGGYPPLYQAGYMLGALQLMALRKEALSEGQFKEKEFNDAILKTGMMPIELVRALLLDLELTPDYKAKWKFFS